MSDNIKPQHDLDAQKQGRAWVTESGRTAIGPRLGERESQIGRLPVGYGEWAHVLGSRENYARMTTPDLIVQEKVNEIIDLLNAY